MGVFSVGGYLPPQTDENGNVVEPPDSWQPMKLAQEIKEEGRQFSKMYIACGEEDPLFPSANQLQEEMKAFGADVTWVPRPGFVHEWRLVGRAGGGVPQLDPSHRLLCRQQAGKSDGAQQKRSQF